METKRLLKFVLGCSSSTAGAIPVGGYSKLLMLALLCGVEVVGHATQHQQQQSSRANTRLFRGLGVTSPSTAGIVTHVKGEAYISGAQYKTPKKLKSGYTALENDKVFVRKESKVTMATVSGGKIELVGPCLVQISKDRIDLVKGAVLVQAKNHEVLRVENPYLVLQTTGSAAMWASQGKTQVLSLGGHNQVWHPKLPQATETLPVAYYSEMGAGYKYLQPKRPVLSSPHIAEQFLERFSKKVSLAQSEEGSRGLASNNSFRGSRSPKDALEPYDQRIIQHLFSSITGRDLDEGDLDPFEGAGKPKKKKH